MNFIRLSDYLLSVLFEDDDILAIDKPYGFNAHTNDSKIEHSDFIEDGLIEIYEKQRGQRLHIIHRLDQTTTGVMIFGKSVESAKKYADFFLQRKVHKTYWFLTKSESTVDSFLIDQKIVHKARELEAKTQLSCLKRSGGLELWQAKPLTGRNHQIRIHANAAQIPILGDAKYGGAVFPFLCLHNQKIEFPTGVVISSQAPVYFENLEYLETTDLAKCLFEMDRRLRLFGSAMSSDQCFRLVHNIQISEDPGFTIDHFGKILVLNWYRENWGDREIQNFTKFAAILQRPLTVRLVSEKAKSIPEAPLTIYPPHQPTPVTPDWVAHENQIRFELRTDSGFSVGLPVHLRLQRQWLADHSRGKSVVILFANNGGFGVAAALGGASDVISIDAGKNALNWARKNFELNGLDVEKFKFFCRDSITFLDQSQSKQSKFDVIVCDAPSFQKREKKIFKIKTELESLLKVCLSCLSANGELLFSTTFDGFLIQDIHKAILSVQKTLKIQNLEINSLLPALDFELPGARVNLKSFLIRLKSQPTEV